MAKTGGAVTKLQDKAKRNAMRVRMGTFKPIISRNTSPFHDKRIAYIVHQRTVCGVISARSGEYVQEPRAIAPAETFYGDGLPDDSLDGFKVPKTNAERAAADKRPPLNDEMVEGWKPQAWRGRRYS
jgi:hypothetical protein